VLAKSSEEVNLARELVWRTDYAWDKIAHPGQIPPKDKAWFCYLMRSGRGGGKTRAGAEWVLQRVRDGYKSIALIGKNAADVRDIMIELGESSICKVAREDEKPIYEPSKRRLTFPSGAVAVAYSDEDPDQLRGPQHDTAWVDELAKFKHPQDTWDNLLMGLRLGDNPQVFVTTTPRPIPLIRDLLNAKDTIDVRFSTFDNADNLSPQFLAKVREKYEGTRLGRQELYGEILDDNPNALWKRDVIENLRVDTAPGLVRVVVGVDPAVSSTDESAETGILTAGVDAGGQYYVLNDSSLQGTPNEWAVAVVRAFHAAKADRVIGEVNNGGDLVEVNLRTVDRNIPFKAVHASRGKLIRAEPIAALYEQGKVHHVGTFPQLEDQMCVSGDTLVETEHGQIRIDEVVIGTKIWTRYGLFPISWVGQTGDLEEVYLITTSDDCNLLATVGHLIYVENKGFITVSKLQKGDVINSWKNMVHAHTTTAITLQSIIKGIIEISERVGCYIESFGKAYTALFQKDSLFIIRTGTHSTTTSTTSKLKPCLNTNSHILGDLPLGSLVTEGRKLKRCGVKESLKRKFASPVGLYSNQQGCEQNSAQQNAGAVIITSVKKSAKKIPVFNLKVDGVPEFYANGILVHNCEWVPGEKSPDRMDALVWALTELSSQPGISGVTYAVVGKRRY